MMYLYSGGERRMIDLVLQVTRGDATMLYATSHGIYTIRIHMHLDQRIDHQKLRIALDKTALRYPYFCVCLKRNEREFYYGMRIIISPAKQMRVDTDSFVSETGFVQAAYRSRFPPKC